MSASQVLPFLAALKKTVPDMSPVDVSGQVSAPSVIDQNQAGPLPPQLANPQQVPAQPDLTMGQGQTPPNPLADLSGSMAQGEQPKFQETKGHKLLRILQSGIQGGLAGYAQNAQTYAQTGRNAGFGGGFQGAFQMPFMQAYQKGQLAQQQAQTELLKQQSQMVQTPYGTMPAAFAKLIFPAIVKGQYGVEGQKVAAGGRVAAAEAAKNVVIVPGKGAYQKDQNGKYQPVEGAQIPNILMTPEEAKAIGHPELSNQEIPMTNYSSLVRASAFGSVPVQGAQGPVLVERNPSSPNYGKVTPLGIGSPSMAGVVPVADPNNPGAITYAPKTAAVGALTPQAAPAQTAKATARSIAPGGRVGEDINAFNTAMQHADLLQQALGALNNGDVRALNSLKNQFKTAFGSSDVTNFQTIAHAYSDEVQKMLASGHITEGEQKLVHGNLPANASPQQILGALQQYRALAQSKLNMRQNQVQAGLKGQAAFPQNAITVTDPAGGVHTFKDQQSADAFKAAIGAK